MRFTIGQLVLIVSNCPTEERVAIVTAHNPEAEYRKWEVKPLVKIGCGKLIMLDEKSYYNQPYWVEEHTLDEISPMLEQFVQEELRFLFLAKSNSSLFREW